MKKRRWVFLKGGHGKKDWDLKFTGDFHIPVTEERARKEMGCTKEKGWRPG